MKRCDSRYLQTSRRPAQPLMKVALDMRLTSDGLARLDAEQVQALFEGFGRLAALGATPR